MLWDEGNLWVYLFSFLFSLWFNDLLLITVELGWKILFLSWRSASSVPTFCFCQIFSVTAVFYFVLSSLSSWEFYFSPWVFLLLLSTDSGFLWRFEGMDWTLQHLQFSLRRRKTLLCCSRDFKGFLGTSWCLCWMVQEQKTRVTKFNRFRCSNWTNAASCCWPTITKAMHPRSMDFCQTTWTVLRRQSWWNLPRKWGLWDENHREHGRLPSEENTSEQMEISVAKISKSLFNIIALEGLPSE